MNAAIKAQSAVELSLQSLIDTRLDVPGFPISRQSGGHDFPGQRLGKKRGNGIEFLDLRQYTAGDDVRHIDWNVTARSQSPYTRLYQQEKEQTTTAIVDLREVMLNGSDCLRAVAAGRLAAATLWYAANTGDRCAAITINSAGIQASRPLSGNQGVLLALEQIAGSFQQAMQLHKSTNRQVTAADPLSNALDIVLKNKRNSGRYFLFSGIDKQDDQHFNEQLPAVATTGRLNTLLLLDRLELNPPPAGSYRYRFNDSVNKVSVNRTTRESLATLLEQQAIEREQQMTDAGIPTISLSTSIDTRDFITTLHEHGWM